MPEQARLHIPKRFFRESLFITIIGIQLFRKNEGLSSAVAFSFQGQVERVKQGPESGTAKHFLLE